MAYTLTQIRNKIVSHVNQQAAQIIEFKRAGLNNLVTYDVLQVFSSRWRQLYHNAWFSRYWNLVIGLIARIRYLRKYTRMHSKPAHYKKNTTSFVANCTRFLTIENITSFTMKKIWMHSLWKMLSTRWISCPFQLPQTTRCICPK